MTKSEQIDMVLDAFNQKVLNASELKWVMEEVLRNRKLSKEQIVQLIAGTEACESCGR